METGYLVPVGPLLQILSDQGVVGSGYKINTYVGGSVSTPLTTYTDSTLITQNSNPIVMGSNGRFQAVNIWVPSGTLTKIVLTDSTGASIPGGSVDNIPGLNDPSTLSAGTIGQVLYPQTATELANSVTPVNYQYEPNHILRYVTDVANVIAGSSSVDNSTGAQNWLTCLTPGSKATLIGIIRAQGLTLRVSDVEFIGGGWIKPIANTTNWLLKIGEDSSSTLCRRVRGLLRVGDKESNYTNWSNITGLVLERAVECDIAVDAYGVQNGISLSPTVSAVGYNQFRLGDVYNCFVGITINPSSTGYANNNRFYGGRLSADSGLWASGNIDIKITAGATNRPNDNFFFGATFEGAAQCWQCAGIDNHILGARWEPGVGGLTPGVSCASVFWEYNDALATRNSVSFSYNSDWMNNPASYPYVQDLGAATQVDSKDFTLTSGTDYTNQLFQGALVNLTIGGTQYLTAIVSSSYSSNVTFKTQTITATGNPTACWIVRISDQGTLNTWEIDNVTGVTNSQAKVFRHMLQFWLNSSLCIQSQDASHPALRLMPASSSGDPVLTTENLSTLETLQITGNGQIVMKGSAAVATSASQIMLGNGVQSTVGPAGAASALPGAPQLYMRLFQGAQEYVIPMWKSA